MYEHERKRRKKKLDDNGYHLMNSDARFRFNIFHCFKVSIVQRLSNNQHDLMTLINCNLKFIFVEIIIFHSQCSYPNPLTGDFSYFK